MKRCTGSGESCHCVPVEIRHDSLSGSGQQCFVEFRFFLLLATFVQPSTDQTQQRRRYLQLGGALRGGLACRCHKGNDAPRNQFGARSGAVLCTASKACSPDIGSNRSRLRIRDGMSRFHPSIAGRKSSRKLSSTL